jgi:hypothetical protein
MQTRQRRYRSETCPRGYDVTNLLVYYLQKFLTVRQQITPKLTSEYDIFQSESQTQVLTLSSVVVTRTTNFGKLETSCCHIPSPLFVRHFFNTRIALNTCSSISTSIWMAGTKRKKSSVSTRISRPHTVTYQVPIGRTVSVHRNTNGRLITSTSHVSRPETNFSDASASAVLADSNAGLIDDCMDVDPENFNTLSESVEQRKEAKPVRIIS